MLHPYLSSTAIFMLTALLNLLTACLTFSRGLGAQDVLLLPILILSIYLMQELTSIFTLSSLTLLKSGTLFLCLFFHLPMIKTLSKEECHDIFHTKLDKLEFPPCLYFSYCLLYRVWRQAGFFLYFTFFHLAGTLLM